MEVDYSHEQFGTFLVAFCALLGLGLGIVFILAGLAPAAAVVGFVCLLLVILFFRLRVEVTGRQLRVRFGMGLVGRSFETAQIVSARAVRNRWFYGWGIRLTPHGWMFNVSGLDAVEIEMRSGKRFRIGTDEPDMLAAALNRARQP